MIETKGRLWGYLSDAGEMGRLEHEEEWRRIMLHEAIWRASLPAVTAIKRLATALPEKQQMEVSDKLTLIAYQTGCVAHALATGFMDMSAEPETADGAETRLAELLSRGGIRDDALEAILDTESVQRLDQEPVP